MAPLALPLPCFESLSKALASAWIAYGLVMISPLTFFSMSPLGIPAGMPL